MADFKTYIDSSGRFFRVVETSLSPELIFEELWRYSEGYYGGKKYNAVKKGSKNIADSGTDYIMHLDNCRQNAVETLKVGGHFALSLFTSIDREKKGYDIKIHCGKNLPYLVSTREETDSGNPGQIKPLFLEAKNKDSFLIGFYLTEKDYKTGSIDETAITPDEIKLIRKLQIIGAEKWKKIAILL